MCTLQLCFERSQPAAAETQCTAYQTDQEQGPAVALPRYISAVAGVQTAHASWGC